MNPGKVGDPDPITADLRLGTEYRPPQLDTHFAYPDDGGSFAHATVRCVGIGKCRHTGGGVMCPSYMVTREERDSTRGRAHLLWAMVNGDELPLWHSPDVLEALDLCLSCKGCTNDCPVNVDLPTLKAEYLAHHYARRLRPRQAYAFGLIDRWARLARVAPRLATRVGDTRWAKAAAGIASRRDSRRHARRRDRAELRRGVPRRADEDAAARRGRAAPEPADVPSRRVPGARRGVRAASARAPRRAAGPLPRRGDGRGRA